MDDRKKNSWAAAVAREAGIRKSIVVYGNISDLAYNPYSGTYDLTTHVVRDILHRRGFEEVLCWDRVSGLAGGSVGKGFMEELSRLSVGSLGEVSPQSQGTAYDIGDDWMEEPAAPAGQLQNPDDFFPMMYHSMIHRTSRRVAFVVDWSDFLFGQDRSLSQQEREWMTLLCKAVRQAPLPMDIDSLSQPSNLIVFLTNNLGMIPSAFYQQNPAVKQIHIPIPSRAEREHYLAANGNLSRLNVAPVFTDERQEGFADFVDMLDGFTLRDIQQLLRLSRQAESVLAPGKLVNLYKYGEQSSPWEELSRDKLADIENVLRCRVKGQDEAIDKVRDVVIRAYTGFAGLQHSAKQKKPKGILFFVGPTGVGKTELAKSLAEFLFGDETACIRFDMSEYSSEHSDQRLIGAPPGYVGYEEGGQLTNAVKQKPFSVLLFDEIEKADGRIMDKFLQILEDGRLTDGKGETVYFSESVIIFTSNIGAAEVPITDDRKTNESQYKQKIREHFSQKLGRPELLNRIGDNIVVFNPIINDDFLISIARAKLMPLQQFIQERYQMSLVFENEEQALRALVRGVDRGHGGRGILNVMEPKIVNPLASFIFENSPYFSPGRRIRVTQVGNSALFDFELE